MPWTLSDDDSARGSGGAVGGGVDDVVDAQWHFSDSEGIEHLDCDESVGAESASVPQDVAIPPGVKERRKMRRRRVTGPRLFKAIEAQHNVLEPTKSDRAALARKMRGRKRVNTVDAIAATEGLQICGCSTDFLVPFIGLAALACSLLAKGQPLRLAAVAAAVIGQLEHYTAGVPMHLSPCVEARLLGASVRTNNRSKVAVGALLYQCSRLFWGLFFRWLYKQIHGKRFRPVACVVYMLYDETRLTVRFEKENVHAQESANDAANQRSPPDRGKRSGGRVHAKVFQAGLTLGFLLFDNMLRAGILIHCDLATHLGQCDRCTAETAWQFLLLLLTLPMLKDLMAEFPFCVRANTADRAASNCRVEHVSRRRSFATTMRPTHWADCDCKRSADIEARHFENSELDIDDIGGHQC